MLVVLALSLLRPGDARDAGERHPVDGRRVRRPPGGGTAPAATATSGAAGRGAGDEDRATSRTRTPDDGSAGLAVLPDAPRDGPADHQDAARSTLEVADDRRRGAAADDRDRRRSAATRAGRSDRAPATTPRRRHFRVPAERWDEALVRDPGARRRGPRRGDEDEDVTSQVVDLGPGSGTSRRPKQALQAIMDRATVIKDVLAVQARADDRAGRDRAADRREGAPRGAGRVLDARRSRSCSSRTPVLVEQQAGFDPATEVEPASAQARGHPAGASRRRASGSGSCGCRSWSRWRSSRA